jgi:hypothetical protein
MWVRVCGCVWVGGSGGEWSENQTQYCLYVNNSVIRAHERLAARAALRSSRSMRLMLMHAAHIWMTLMSCLRAENGADT